MRIKDGVIGFAIGDAMGVPTEFHKKEELLKKTDDEINNFVVKLT